MTVLDRILAAKQAEIARLRHRVLPTPPARRAVQLSRPAGEPLRLMAEIKHRSPSAGPLSSRLSVAERAAAYERGGARMVSVLCDREFFAGDFTHLAQARQACSLPLLCKDFILDERQLDAARAFGADAVLLIVRCLSPQRLAQLLDGCRERQLDGLVEVANVEEAGIALEQGAALVGVNARDLATLEMDPDRANSVLCALPAAVTSVHLSGISDADAVRRLARSPAHAALVGEALMRQDDPEELLRALVAAAGAD
jgi:indole-3-glycerol phosphate synthase